MKIQYIIMAHISRMDYADNLKKEIGAQSMSIDRGELGLVGAHIQAWGMADGISDYTCVLQDDALLTDNFIQKAQYHVKQCVEKYGRIALHFYLRKSPKFVRPMQQWKREGRDHVVLPNVYAGLAICLPSEIIPRMLQYFDSENIASGDKRINKYLRREGIKVYFPLPSLVEHRNLPSLHNGNSSPIKNRVAMWFE